MFPPKQVVYNTRAQGPPQGLHTKNVGYKKIALFQTLDEKVDMHKFASSNMSQICKNRGVNLVNATFGYQKTGM